MLIVIVYVVEAMVSRLTLLRKLDR